MLKSDLTDRETFELITYHSAFAWYSSDIKRIFGEAYYIESKIDFNRLNDNLQQITNAILGIWNTIDENLESEKELIFEFNEEIARLASYNSAFCGLCSIIEIDLSKFLYNNNNLDINNFIGYIEKLILVIDEIWKFFDINSSFIEYSISDRRKNRLEERNKVRENFTNLDYIKDAFLEIVVRCNKNAEHRLKPDAQADHEHQGLIEF